MFLEKENNDLSRFFQGAFLVFIAVFPFILYEGYLFNGTATRFINTVIFVEALSLVFGIFLLRTKQRLSLVLSPVTISLTVLLILMGISAFLGVDPHVSFWSKATRTAGLFYFIHITFWYLFFWFSCTEKKQRSFLSVFAISGSIFSFLSFAGREGLGLMFTSDRWSGFTIGNSTFAGMYLYATFLISIYLLVTTKKINRTWWSYILPFSFFVSPYLISFDLWKGKVQSIGDIIGSAQASSFTLFFSIGVLSLFFLVKKYFKPNVRKALLFVGMFLAIVVFSIGARSLLTQGSFVQQAYLKQSTATRPIVWEFSKKAIAERPVWGWGGDNFDQVFQKYYDPKILEKKNGGEAWLDRAHNIFIDQAIETGYVGLFGYLFIYIVVFGSLIFVLIRSKNNDDLSLSAILLVYFFGHLLELQTAFDTTITYPILVMFSVYTGILLYRTKKTENTLSPKVFQFPYSTQKIIGIFLITASVFAFIKGSLPIMSAEVANGAIRRVGSSEKRLRLYPTLFSSPLDRASFLWRTSNDLQRGVSLDPKMFENKNQREALQKEIEMIVQYYERYTNENPKDYRSLLNLADMYIYQRLFEIDHLEKAHDVLDKAVILVPQSPQPYWMKAVTYLYQAKFALAKEWAQRALALNHNIEESQRLVEYIDQSIKDFPVIDLYSFRQI